MSKHHHHPHEGHSAGDSPETSKGHLRHNWFFYVAGFFILVALIGFVLSSSPGWQTPVPLSQAAPATGGEQK